MNFNILKIFKQAIYREKDFYISKKENETFKVTAQSGLVADIFIHDHVMFVDIVIPQNKETLRYSTPLGETILSDKDFIIWSVKNTILFKLPFLELTSYLKKRDEIFSEFKRSSLIHLYMRGYEGRDEHRFKDDCFYTYTKHNDICYQHVFFTKKKIVKNIYKYSYHTQPTDDCVDYPTSIHYCIGELFFEVCNLQKFMASIAEHSQFDFSFNSDKYGINNQLTEHYNTYTNLIDLSKVILLKRANRNYCTISKNNGKIILTYLTNNFNINYSTLEKTTNYKKKMNDVLNVDKVPQFYELERLITHTYFKGKTTTHSVKFTRDDVANHEMTISNTIMDNIETLKMNFPSQKIIDKLKNLGIFDGIPLNTDTLSVLDMYQI